MSKQLQQPLEACLIRHRCDNGQTVFAHGYSMVHDPEMRSILETSDSIAWCVSHDVAWNECPHLRRSAATSGALIKDWRRPKVKAMIKDAELSSLRFLLDEIDVDPMLRQRVEHAGRKFDWSTLGVVIALTVDVLDEVALDRACELLAGADRFAGAIRRRTVVGIADDVHVEIRLATPANSWLSQF